VAAFNEAYFRRGAAKAGDPVLVPWDLYFFPLDGIRNWNRLYGRRGFLQHQCVIPTSAARPALAAILDIVSRRANPSFLAVLKQLGGGFGPLSFPLEGYTLALDLPVSDGVFPILDEIDRHVVAAGGRLYLAKDARQSRATFEAGYPDLARFRDIRRAVGADRHIASRLSARLGL
jgi:decaprenylphospho-beta-D-ribofuranose 2-oxidase